MTIVSMRAIPRVPAVPSEEVPFWAEWLWSGFGCDIYDIARFLDIDEEDADRALRPMRARRRQSSAGLNARHDEERRG